MRGTVTTFYRDRNNERITPAHAGNSPYSYKVTDVTEDHPRTCGEQTDSGGIGSPESGSPPHMRGTANGMQNGNFLVRITPAHAGNSLGNSPMEKGN